MINAPVESVWCNDVARDYQNGWVCSERALQSSIYYHLRKARGAEKVFSEPAIAYVGGSPNRVPDLVLTEKNIVVAIIELKYYPEWSPIRRDLEPDVLRLRDIAQDTYGRQWSLSTGRCSEVVELSSETKYYLGVIGIDIPRKMSKFGLWQAVPSQVASSFALLVGNTASSQAKFQEYAWEPLTYR